MTNRTWQPGDTVTVGSTRWIIRALNRQTRKVALASSNTTNSGIWWNTTLDNLPARAVLHG